MGGGKSLATPVFAGKWAILNRLNDSSLGQAAPLIAQFAGTLFIEDIIPEPAPAVLGATLSTTGITSYSARDLAQPETSQPFVSALWQTSVEGAGNGDDYVITFGRDSSLAVTAGYDSATGWGQLNIAALSSDLVNLNEERTGSAIST